MKLLTEEIEKRLAKYPLYSQEGNGKDAVIVCKFFNPYGRGTWYVLEGDKLPDGDWEFFGIVDIYEKEYGYFRLSELQSIVIRFAGHPIGGIERDINFKNVKVKEVA